MSARELRPGLCSVTFRALSPERVIALAAEAGLAGIEWGADVHVPAGDTARAALVREQSEKAGVAVASYGSYVLAGSEQGQPFAAALETAQALGAPSLRLWAGAMGRPSSSYTEEERAQCARALQEMAARAEEAGITLSLEFHPGTLTDTLASAIALLEAVGSERVFTHWQPRPGIGRAEAEAELAALPRWLSHLHVFQWDAASRRYPLAEGAAFWRAALDAARPANAWPGPRYAMLEFVAGDAEDAFRRDAAVLREWLER